MQDVAANGLWVVSQLTEAHDWHDRCDQGFDSLIIGKSLAHLCLRIIVHATLMKPITKAHPRATIAASFALYGLPAPSSFLTAFFVMRMVIYSKCYIINFF